MKTIFLLGIGCLLLVFGVEINAQSYRIPINSTGITQILNSHNSARSELSASPALVSLVWNTTLADYWSTRNPSICNTSGLVHYSTIYGENLAGSSNLQTLTYLVNLWYQEKANFIYPTGCSGVCGHYTQMIWANTLKVGCAYFNCSGFAGVSSSSRYRLVCNYDPSGNYIGQAPYQCSQPVPVCGAGVCGTLSNTCGQQVNCGTSNCSSSQSCVTNQCTNCASQCGTNTCGSVLNTCYNGGSGGTEICGTCNATQTCQANQCVNSGTCTPTFTSANCSSVCGSYSDGCGSVITCTCSGSSTCQLVNGNNICVAPPCGGPCPSPQTCDTPTNTCVCPSGYVKNTVTGNCDLVPPGNPLQYWSVIYPTGISTNWRIIDDGSLQLTAASGHSYYRLKWDSSQALISEVKTTFETDVYLSGDGKFGLGFRNGSSQLFHALWYVTIRGNRVVVEREGRTGSAVTNYTKTPPSTVWVPNSWNNVKLTTEDRNDLDTTGVDYIWFSLKINNQVVTTYSLIGYGPKSNFPSPFNAFIHGVTPNLGFKNSKLYSTTYLLVTFAGCLNATTINSLKTATGASNVTVQSCGSRKRQGELSTAVVFTFLSTDLMSSEALAAQFQQAALSKSFLFNDVQVLSVESGANQLALDEPVTPNEITAENIDGANNGGEGAGGDGLSTGAIAGIVAGSVVGGLIIGAVALAVIAAIIFAVVKIASKGSDSSGTVSVKSTKDPRKIGGSEPGVDLYDLETDGHKSITARAPEIKD